MKYLVFFVLFFGFYSSVSAEECSIPPFVGAGVKPNVVIMLDNSGSMKSPMYWDPDLSNWRCKYGVHDDFDPQKTYYGMFNPKKNYSYDSNILVYQDAYSGDPYTVYSIDTKAKGAFIKSTCDPITDDSCWSGNFLNWLVTRRIDAARVALVGGKVESRDGYDYDLDGKKEWKIIGNNEPGDEDFCKVYINSRSYSPYPNSSVFKVYSPANKGTVKNKYDPYAKLRIQANTILDKNGYIIGEFGEVDINSSWKTISLLREYQDPILIVGPPSYNGGDPCSLRIKELDSTSFKIRIQEWPYKDGIHTTETVFYMIVERGTHFLPGEKKLIADKITVSNYITHNKRCGHSMFFQPISFPNSFSKQPIVITAIIHDREDCNCPNQNSCMDSGICETLTVRLRNIDTSGFEIALEMQEGTYNNGNPQIVHYIAVEPGEISLPSGSKMCVATQSNVKSSWNTINFCSNISHAGAFLAAMQTTNGGDTAVLRHKELSDTEVKVFIEEEKSCDTETNHTNEDVGYFVFDYPEYNIALLVDEEPEGIIQRVANKVRLGVTVYNYRKENGSVGKGCGEYDGNIYTGETCDGGTFIAYIPQNPFVKDPANYRSVSTTIGASVEKIVDVIEHYPLIWGTTPLAENLYEVIRYFKQEPPYYSNEAYIPNKGGKGDPYYYESQGELQRCAKSFVIVFTDGEPWRDCNVPSLKGCIGGGEECNDSGPDCDTDQNEPKSDFCSTYGNKLTDYLDDVAWWAHNKDETKNRDLRLDIEGDQYLTIYTVAFGTSEYCSEYENQVACEDGGCVWINNTCWPTSEREQCRKQILQDTAKNGGGEFYYANDGAKLEKAFTSILEAIIRTGSAGAVATVTQEVVEEDIVIRGAFTAYEPEDPSTYVWKGHLEVYWPYEGCKFQTNQKQCEKIEGCFWVNGNCEGSIYSFQLPENEGKFCSDKNFTGGHCWDAGEVLKNQHSRQIFTFLISENGTIKRKISLDDVDTNYFALDEKSDFNGDSTVNNEDVDKLKNWIKGLEDGDGIYMRQRDGWFLGDIVYSTPVVVGTPSLASVPKQIANQNCDCTCVNEQGEVDNNCAKSCFYCYRYKNLHRDRVVYVGANDGMLHAFLVGKWDNQKWIHDPNENNDIGKELWAYIPSNLLSELKCLAKPSYGTEGGCQHRTMVDLSPEAWDVYIRIDTNNDGSLENEIPQWRTILIGGERGGGDVYFVIDVTDPHNPKVLWEYSVLRNMANINGNHINFPYSNKTIYRQIKNVAASWSKPYVGRLNVRGTTFHIFSEDGLLKSYNGDELSGWFAFIGGGARIFNTSGELISEDSGTAFFPYLVALDIEKGINIFQTMWPYLRNQVITSIPGSLKTKIPYVMASPLVLDVNGDGYVDRLYVGDLNGLFYGLKFGNSYDDVLKLHLDIWRTKKDFNPSSNLYRSDWQPIIVQPTATFDSSGNLWIYFGTGKFDDVGKGNDDKTDKAKMSFYALKDTEQFSLQKFSCIIDNNQSISCDDTSKIIHFHLCENYNEYCTWIMDNGQPDCCENNCSNSCFSCIYDFTKEGERVIDSALVAGGLVFVTTFVPSEDPCQAGGEGYLYAFDYNCNFLEDNPFKRSGLKSEAIEKTDNKAKAYRVQLGPGMPSRPVLDSSGKNLLVQESTGKIHRIKIDLPLKPLYLKGWKEE